MKNRYLNNMKKCPCGDNKAFESCCSLIFQDHKQARTPEQLMRSRYTAYVLQNKNHLFRTWDYVFRPDSLSLNTDIIWIGLEIIKSWLHPLDSETGYVHFIAQCIEKDTLNTMEETSVFTKKEDLWLYQQGDLNTQQYPLSLNSLCPCGSRKKFKRCCKVR